MSATEPRHLPRGDAWRLAGMALAGGAPCPADAFTSDLGRELRAAIVSANGLGPAGGLEAHLTAHYPDSKDAIIGEILEADPNGDEPTDAPAKEPRYKLLRASDALQPQPPRDEVIHGLVGLGDVVVTFGDAGTKKTLCWLDAGVCVALEAPWLHFPTTGGPVLFIDEESGPRRLLRRLGDVLRGHHAPAETPIVATSLALFDLRSATDLAEIEQLILSVQPVLVIIDALMDVLPGADENSVADVLPVFRQLRRLAETHRCAIVLIHHAGKNGGYRGSSAIKGAVDLLLMVESKDGSPNIDFSTEKTRDTEPTSFAAAAHFGIGDFHLSATGSEQPRAPRFKPAEAYVLEYIDQHGGRASIDDITINAEVCSAGTARNATYTLAQRGYLRRCNEGGRGVAAEYERSDPGCHDRRGASDEPEIPGWERVNG